MTDVQARTAAAAIGTEARAPDWHRDLPEGTVLRHTQSRTRIRVVDNMRGDHAYVVAIRKDGERDRRRIGWSGPLCVHLWEIEPNGSAS